MTTPSDARSAQMSTTSRTSTVDSPRRSPQAAAIEVIDRLHGADPNQKLPLPTVAVTGAQSAGKSSFLSALLDIPLHSDVDTATLYGLALIRTNFASAPTEIHSRYKSSPFSATIHIEYERTQERRLRRAHFTESPITDKGELLQAMRWAGNEARRLHNGGQLRTYEHLQTLNEEAITRGEEKWVKFTTNKIILWVSTSEGLADYKAEGPDQRDISAIDLPGLGNQRNDELKRLSPIASSANYPVLYEEILRRPECLVILVLAMGGDLPLFDIVKRTRPDFHQVLGILTKVDLVKKIARGAWGRMLLGTNAAMSSIRPQHQFHPLYLRDADMYDDDMSRECWLKKQRDHFEKPELREFAEQCGRSMGWEPTSEKIYQLFADLARDQRRIERDLDRNGEELAGLPPKVDNPASLLHDKVITPIAHDLELSFERRGSRIRKLLEPMRQLQEALAASIRASFPLMEVEVDSHIFTTIHGKLNEYRNVRDDSRPDVSLAVREMTKACLDGWTELANEANVNTWSALDTIVKDTVKDNTEGRPRVLEPLHKLHKSHEEGVREYIASVMSKELSRQDLIDDNALTSKEASKVVGDCKKEFYAYCDLFEKKGTGGGGGEIMDLTQDYFKDFYPPSDANPGKWPRAYRVLCIETAALVYHRITKAARRLHEELLREINFRMLTFMQESQACLRRAFELDEVTVERKRKLTELCDVDRETAQKRTKLEEERKNLAELEALIKVDLDD